VDLATDGAQANREQSPILLLISQQECPFCHQIKRDILRPMIKAGDHRGELLIRELFIDPGYKLKDFSGNPVSGKAFARRYGVRMTPTLLFLDPDGRELTEKMVGIQTPEMYFFYVDQSIRQAIDRLRKRR
jgi:thioredoxin-related protein